MCNVTPTSNVVHKLSCSFACAPANRRTARIPQPRQKLSSKRIEPPTVRKPPNVPFCETSYWGSDSDSLCIRSPVKYARLVVLHQVEDPLWYHELTQCVVHNSARFGNLGAESNAAMYTVVEGYPYLVALQNKIKTRGCQFTTLCKWRPARLRRWPLLLSLRNYPVARVCRSFSWSSNEMKKKAKGGVE